MFNINNHYWKIAESLTEVYSSKVSGYVPVNNADYVTWETLPDNYTTPIATEQELYDVLNKENIVGKENVFKDSATKIKAQVPVEVTMRQARLALLNAGLLANVTAAIAAMTGAAGDSARIEWEFSSTVQRNKPLVLSLGAALSLTEAQIDDLFITAKSL